MNKKIFLSICLLLCAVCLCGCSLKDFSVDATRINLRNKNYVLMDRSASSPVIENTNFYVFSAELGNISQSIFGNFYTAQKSFYADVYGNFRPTFSADEAVSFASYDASVGTFDIVSKGNNGWSIVLYNICKYNSVTEIVEFWDVDKNGEPMWFVVMKCYEKTETADYAKNLWNLLKKINVAVTREDGQQADDDKAFSWALGTQVEVDYSGRYVAMYTPNAKSLIK